MTIEHAPSTNGHVAAGERYPEQQQFVVAPARRGRRMGDIVRLLAPALVALAAIIVMRGITQDPDE